jgi:hypothetical protein
LGTLIATAALTTVARILVLDMAANILVLDMEANILALDMAARIPVLTTAAHVLTRTMASDIRAREPSGIRRKISAGSSLTMADLTFSAAGWRQLSRGRCSLLRDEEQAVWEQSE